MKSKSKQSAKDKVSKIISVLKKTYPDTNIPLHFGNPNELLFATILSAQCADERVNKTTAELFKKYKTIDDYADADLKDLEESVRQCGFYRNKAKNIKNSARIIRDEFNGKVPQTMEDLIKLPGVARKTANIVLSHCFSKMEGIAVDTHVIRISNILKLTKESDPVKIERDLMDIVERKFWADFSLLIQKLGRSYCKARKTDCQNCPLFVSGKEKICPKKN